MLFNVKRGGFLQPISLLVKPASGACNLRCRYCFYSDEMKRRETPCYAMMSPETLENMLRRTFCEPAPAVSIAFQGGEPMLAGLEFYRTAVRLIERYRMHGTPVQLAVQTNGTLIDDEWAAFFAENHFLIGISLDGTRQTHDLYRTGPEGDGTFQTVMRAIRILREHRVEYNILTVVTAQAARRAEEIYRFYAHHDLRYQQYIPCLDPLGEARGQHVYSLTPEDFEKFLKEQFACWYQDIMHGRFVYNRYFDNLVGMLLRRPPESCGMMGECGRQLVVEADGSVYPCDFYVLDRYRLGSLNVNSLKEVEQKRDALGFVDASRKVEKECLTCRWYPLCRGGCRRDRERPDGTLGLNCYCKAYRGFFEYAISGLEQVARLAQTGGFGS